MADKILIRDFIEENRSKGEFLNSQILIDDLMNRISIEIVANTQNMSIRQIFFTAITSELNQFFLQNQDLGNLEDGSRDLNKLDDLDRQIFFDQQNLTEIKELNFNSGSETKIESYFFDKNKISQSKIDTYKIIFNRNDDDLLGLRIQSGEENIKNSFLILPVISPPILGANQKQLYKPLFKYQVSGADFLIKQKTTLLADDPGMGKTVTAITALRILFGRGKIKKALIVVPKSTLGDAERSEETGDAIQWEGHIKLWAPELICKTIVPVDWVGGRPPPGYAYQASKDRQVEWYTQAHIFLTTYDIIRNDIKKGNIPLDFFDCIVLDEAQNIKNPQSQRSQAIRMLKSEYRWSLTGTPVENSVKDLRGIFQFLRPSEFPEMRSKDIEFLQLSDIIDFTRDFTIRRTKNKDELPPKNYHEEWIQLSPAQRDVYSGDYDARVRRLRGLLRDEIADVQLKKSIFGTITRLKQICNFAPHEDTSPKVEKLISIIQNSIEKNEKVLVFSQFVKNGVKRIYPHVKEFGTVMIYGGMTKDERNDALEDFQNNENIRVMLCSLQAAGVGLNLQEASTVVHFDHWWNPARMWQAEDRAHRYGQIKEVNVYSLWVKNSIEEKISKILKKKRRLIKQVQEELSWGEAEKQIEDNLMSVDDWREVFDL